MDGAGNIYISSATTELDGKYHAVTKFSPSGQILWSVDNPYKIAGEAEKLVLTPDGGVLALYYLMIPDGETTIDRFSLQKWSAAGVLEWSTFTADLIADVAVDSAGNIFATYDRILSLTESEAFVEKRNSAGSVQWTSTPTLPIGIDRASLSGVLPDNAGGAYSVGYMVVPGSPLHPLIGHMTGPGPAGDMRYPDAPTYRITRAPGGFYAWGDLWVSRFDTAMNVLWSKTYTPATGSFRGLDVATIDPQGNFVGAGSIAFKDPSSVDEKYDLLTIKFDLGGNLVYANSFDGSAHQRERADAVTCDGSGNAFVLAGSDMAGSPGGLVVLRYGPAGNLQWPNSAPFYNGALVHHAHDFERGGGIFLNATGHIFVPGVFMALKDYGLFCVKYGPPDSAQYMSQVVPSTMVAGQSYWVSLTFRNTGLTTWTQAGGYDLQSRNPTDNTLWGRSRVALSPTDSIGPGDGKSFGFYAIAPANAGSYPFQWKMRKEGVGGIGTPSTNRTISVVLRQHAARYVSQVVPTSVKAGSTFTVKVTMRNVGTNTWNQAAGYSLRPAPGLPAWNVPSVGLLPGDSIPRGADKSFTFSCKAPSSPGSYPMRWQMYRSSPAFAGFFGDLSTSKTITVTP